LEVHENTKRLIRDTRRADGQSTELQEERADLQRNLAEHEAELKATKQALAAATGEVSRRNHLITAVEERSAVLMSTVRGEIESIHTSLVQAQQELIESQRHQEILEIEKQEAEARASRSRKELAQLKAEIREKVKSVEGYQAAAIEQDSYTAQTEKELLESQFELNRAIEAHRLEAERLLQELERSHTRHAHDMELLEAQLELASSQCHPLSAELEEARRKCRELAKEVRWHAQQHGRHIPRFLGLDQALRKPARRHSVTAAASIESNDKGLDLNARTAARWAERATHDLRHAAQAVRDKDQAVVLMQKQHRAEKDAWAEQVEKLQDKQSKQASDTRKAAVAANREATSAYEKSVADQKARAMTLTEELATAQRAAERTRHDFDVTRSKAERDAAAAKAVALAEAHATHAAALEEARAHHQYERARFEVGAGTLREELAAVHQALDQERRSRVELEKSAYGERMSSRELNSMSMRQSTLTLVEELDSRAQTESSQEAGGTLTQERVPVDLEHETGQADQTTREPRREEVLAGLTVDPSQDDAGSPGTWYSQVASSSMQQALKRVRDAEAALHGARQAKNPSGVAAARRELRAAQRASHNAFNERHTELHRVRKGGAGGARERILTN